LTPLLRGALHLLGPALAIATEKLACYCPSLMVGNFTKDAELHRILDTSADVEKFARFYTRLPIFSVGGLIVCAYPQSMQPTGLTA